MSEIVFAVEVTSRAVCVALGTQGLRGAKIERLVVRDLPLPPPPAAATVTADADAELQARARPVLSSLIAELGLRGHAGAFVVPDRDVFTRLLTFPFAPLRRAEMSAAVGGELEGLLPLELDELVFSFDVLPRGSAAADEEGARVLAQAIPLRDARGWLEFAEACGFTAITLLSPLGALAEVAAGRPKPAATVVLIDLEGDRTDVAVLAGNKLMFARSLGRGADDIVRWQQAGAGGAAQAAFDEAGLALWLRDVQQSLQASHDKLGLVPTMAIFSGQAAGAVGQVAGAQLGLPVGGLAELLDTTLSPAGTADHVTVVAAALSRGRDKPTFDLRQGALAIAGDMSFVRAKASVLAASAAAILLFAAAAGWAAYYKENQAYATLSARLKRESLELFGSAKDAKTVLDEAGGSLTAVVSPVPKMTAYDIFVEINDKLPGKDKVTLDVTSLEISADKISLRGSAKTSDEIDLIDSALKSISCFSEASRGQTQTGSKGEKTFQLAYKQTCM